MGTVNGIQGELDFDRLIPENASPVFKAIPRAIPQKAEPPAKTADRFIFEPLPDGNTADYSEFPANRMYIAGEETTRKALQSWIENEHRQMPGKKHTKHRDTGISR
jgi:hypothetical protein